MRQAVGLTVPLCGCLGLRGHLYPPRTPCTPQFLGQVVPVCHYVCNCLSACQVVCLTVLLHGVLCLSGSLYPLRIPYTPHFLGLDSLRMLFFVRLFA